MAGLPPIAFLAIGLTVLALFGIGVGIFVFVNPSRSARDRLDDLTTPDRGAPAPDRLATVSSQVAKVAAPGTGTEDHDALKKRLIQAGFRSRYNVEQFSTIRFTLAVFFPLLWALIPANTSTAQTVGIALLLSATGYYLPAIWVTNLLQKRQAALLSSFPDALDLLVASVEAGLGLDASFRRVADELEQAGPLLTQELRLVNHEVAAGLPRTEALAHLETRTGLDEISALVNVLIQSERFGTPVARSLRVHSDMVRTRRMQKAEEAAAKISPKLTVAMILFMLPCLIIVLLGPAIVNVVRNLLPALGS